MVKPALGAKRVCPSCEVRFYDLNKSPAECPKCEAVFSTEDHSRGRRGRAPDSAAKAKTAAAVRKAPLKVKADEESASDGADSVAADGDLADDDKDESVLVETSDSDKDDSDMAEAMENVGAKESE